MLWRFRENSRLTEHLIHEGIVKRQISLARLDIRNWCIVAVTLSTFLSVAAIVFGVLIVFHTQSLPGFLEGKCAETNLQQISWTGIDNYVLQHFAFGSTRLASLIILLVINIVLTCLLDAHNRIDSVAFLWLLRRESTRKPRYNCNPRFFTGTRRFGPCHWSINIIAAFTMALCYGGTATMVSQMKILGVCAPASIRIITEEFPGTHYGVDISGYPLAILGGALLVQNIISIWTLLVACRNNRNVIASWDTDPVGNAICMTRAAAKEGSRTTALAMPFEVSRQNLRNQIPKARDLLWIMWGVSAFMILAVGLTVYYAVDASAFSAEDIQKAGLDIWQFWGFVYIIFPGGDKTSNWAGALIQSVMQGILAGTMHCGDVLVGFKNDEVRWQQAQAESSVDFVPRRYWIQWRIIPLFVAKTGIQFVFSFAISVDIIFGVAAAPLIVVTAILLLVVLVLEFMVRQTPRTGAATTYGEFKLLIKYISQNHQAWLE